jgi:ubiquinone/menaquinone biosynthesis C-methylase UbiE
VSNALAAKLFKCLSEPLRVRLVRVLAEEELNVHELQAVLAVPQSTLSRHLGVLKDNGLLDARRQGPSSYYKFRAHGAANGATLDLVRLVRGLVEDDAAAKADLERLGAVQEERRRAVREYFDQHGASWDAFHQQVADHSVQRDATVRLVPRGLTVVDAGCGSGYLLPELAATGARVIAVDHAPNQLQKARERALSLGLSGVEFRAGDLAALPVDDASVDAVFAYLSLHHIPSPEAAVRDMRRVLRPGGVLVITDFRAHEEAWLASEHADLWLGFDPAQVASWMRAAGLADIRLEERPYAKDGKVAKNPGAGARAAGIPGPSGRGAAGLTLFVISGTVPPTQR